MLDICGITALYLSHLCYLRVTSFSWYHAGVRAHVQYLKEVNYNSEDISSQQRSLKHSFIRPVKTKNCCVNFGSEGKNRSSFPLAAPLFA